MMAFRRIVCHHSTISMGVIRSRTPPPSIIKPSTTSSPTRHKLPRYNLNGRSNFHSSIIVSSNASAHDHHDAYPTSFETTTPSKSGKKRLDIAIVGAPNAGKSQLLNSLVGTKVAAVSRKRHTTRTGILGARTFFDDYDDEGNSEEEPQNGTQLVFIDTPGFLHHSMSIKEGVKQLLGEASSEMLGADYVLIVVDAARKLEEDYRKTLVTLIFLALRSQGRKEIVLDSNSGDQELKRQNILRNKFAVVLNKVDLVSPKEKLLELVSDVGSMAECCIRLLLQQRRNPARVRLGDLVESVLQNHSEESGFDNVHDDDLEIFATLAPEFFFTSAITKGDEGIDHILGLLLARATPSKQWIVDADSPSGMSPVEQVEEIIREKIYRCLHKEVPHCVQQQNRMFKVFVRKQRVETPGNATESDKGGDKNKNLLLRIHQDLVVSTKSHHRLVLGSGGKTLERIRSTALRDLEEAFLCNVDLQMNVRINKTNQEVPLEADGEEMNRF